MIPEVLTANPPPKALVDMLDSWMAANVPFVDCIIVSHNEASNRLAAWVNEQRLDIPILPSPVELCPLMPVIKDGRRTYCRDTLGKGLGYWAAVARIGGFPTY